MSDAEVASPVRRGIRGIGRDTIVYGAGVVAQRVASAVMLPVYTRLLDPADYGLLAMLSITLDVAGILVSAGMTSGVMRFYYKTDSDEARRRVLASAVVILVGLNLAGTLLIVLASPMLWTHLLDGRGELWYVWLAAANLTVGSFASVPMMYMQIRGMSLHHTLIGLVTVIAGLALNIILLVVLRFGPVAILISTFTTGTLIGGATVVWLLRETGLKVSRDAMRDLRRFGVPYQFVTAGTFLMTYGDRFFLNAADGLGAVGQYSLAYQFGFLFMGLGPLPFLKAWTPVRHEQLQLPQEERDEQYNLALRWFTLLIGLLAVGMAVFAAPGLSLLATAEYHLAINLIPVIVLAYVFLAWNDVVQFGIDVSERTQFSTHATWAAVIFILLLQALLIPRFGVTGAAAATLATFVFRFLLYVRAARRLTPIRYERAPHLTCLALGVVTAAAERLLRPQEVVGQIALASALWLAFAVSAVWLVLRSEDRAALRSGLRTPSGRFVLFGQGAQEESKL